MSPRIEDNIKSIKNIKKAILVLAGNLDGVAWKGASDEERKTGIEIYDIILKILEDKET